MEFMVIDDRSVDSLVTPVKKLEQERGRPFTNSDVLYPRNKAEDLFEKGEKVIDAGFVDEGLDMIRLSMDLHAASCYHAFRTEAGQIILKTKEEYEEAKLQGEEVETLRALILDAQDLYRQGISQEASLQVSVNLFIEIIRKLRGSIIRN